jgi:hypothetical protein
MSADRRDLLEAGATMALDSAAVELSELLHARGVRAILLRGPSIGKRLYADRSRSYEDIDLLIDLADLAEVEDAVRTAGFELTARDVHAAPWIRRSDGMNLDLHTTLIGVGAPAETVWRELAAATEPLQLGSREVEVLQAPGLALNVALHAAQHGVEGGKSLEDLSRALETLPEDVWAEAASLAERLDAVPAFATGLRLLPAGAARAERLGLPVERSRELALRAGSAPPTALGFWRLAETRGVRKKVRLIARELAPSAAFMRAMYPVARRGPAGLAAAYVWRPLQLARQVGPGFVAWRRARRG